ncbi:MAG: hypothetical protein J7K62_03225 [Thermoplasmata archaeon]|nr:hypothetical protein [Thermoplasmata archaeon]
MKNKVDINIYIRVIAVLLFVVYAFTMVYFNNRLSDIDNKVSFIYNLFSKIQPTNNNQQPQVSWKNDCSKSFDNKSYDGVFIYMSTCPHCTKMKPLVESSDMKWYWIDAVNSTCYSDLNFTKFGFNGYVPHFYCIRTGKSHTGEMSEDLFNEWVRECKNT